VLDGPTRAGIFLGKVKNWDDSAIKKLNPNAKLPSQPIAVVHRSEGSGLLSTSRTIWHPIGNRRSASATSVEWPVGIGAKGNEGVSNNVSQTSGSIGYVEYTYAKRGT
jgi:phosphate transport system substrate-binding protein